MAKPISTTIRISDKASAPLLNISKNLGKCINGFMRLNQVSSNAISVGTMGSSDAILESINENVGQIRRQMQETSYHADDFEDNIKGANTSSSSLLSTLKRVAATYLTMQAAGQVIDTSDAIALAEQRMALTMREGETIDDVNKKIMASANSARTSYTDMYNQVSKLGMNAGNSFDNTDQIIAFVEQFDKLAVLGGASVYESSQAMYQLTQSMAKGKLDGDELRSVMEGMPLVAKTIAEYLGTNVGTMKEMAAEGLVTADVVRNALLGSATETNDKVENLGFTWAQTMQLLKNNAIVAFEPVLTKINEIANNDKVQSFIGGLVGGMAFAASIIMGVFNILSGLFGFIYDNWSIIGPLLAGAIGILLTYLAVTKGITLAKAILTGIMGAFTAIQTFVSIGYGVLTGNTAAASAAQFVYNSALLACPLTWILMIIIAVIAAIYAVIGVINKVTGSTISATGVIFGAIAAVVAAIWNIFLGLVDLVMGIISAFINKWAMFANFFANVFNDPIGSIIHLFGDMADNVLGVVETIAKALDKVFGSNLAGTVSDWRSGLNTMVEEAANKYGNGSYEKVVEEVNWSSETLGLSRWAYGDAYNSGYSMGEGLEDSIGGMFSMEDYGGGLDYDTITSSLGNIEENTGTTADAVDISQEDLKYLRDIAEHEAINKFTTAKITVDMTNNNSVSSNMDLDGIVDHLATRVTEAMEVVAAGAY